MTVIPVDPRRFNSTASVTENAEKQRISVSRSSISNARPAQPDNGDFINHPDKRGTFSKGLKHDAVTGRVDAAAFAAFQTALAQPRDMVFAAIDALTPHIGAGMATRKWVNPVAGRAWSVAGGDPQQFVMQIPSAFGSDELSFEMLENYWMALLRDVPFSQYEISALATQAAQELTAFRNAAVAERLANGRPAENLALTDVNGNITPATLFRGLAAGEDKGPYLSQFLIHPVPFGVQGFHQRNKTLRAGQDFMTQWAEWLVVQNGAPRDFAPSHFDETLHYLRNGRDLSQWVHIDVLFQGYFNACLMLLQGGSAASSVGGGIGSPSLTSNSSPYKNAQHQQGFGTLGDPGHIGLMCEVAAHALKAVWFQKWYVHLRMRPEVYAARIDYQRRTPNFFNLPAALMNSQGVVATVGRYGSALLPMAFPEGSPMHPAYGAGHATVAGACVTILKALFKVDEKFPIPVDVLVDSSGNEHLVPYGNDLTIEGELNKLASNVALGRNIAGVHWRSDGTYSMQLGEEVAINLLEVYAKSYAEVAPGATVFQFKKFDGTQQTITA
jgi:hypothetical protein